MGDSRFFTETSQGRPLDFRESRLAFSDVAHPEPHTGKDHSFNDYRRNLSEYVTCFKTPQHGRAVASRPS